MEKVLDKIEDGDVEWIELLKKFYNTLEEDLTKYEEEIEKMKDRRILSDIMDSQGNPMLLKTGRFGKYLISETAQEEKITLKGISVNPEEIQKGHVFVKDEVEKLRADKKGLLTDYFTEEGKRYILKKGRFGEYLESEDYANDEKRMALPLSIKQKLKKNTVNEVDGIFLINEELSAIIEEENKIKEAAGVCEKCGKPFEIKMGRFGKFLACTGYPECKNIKAIPKEKKTASRKITNKKTSVEKKDKKKEVVSKKSTGKKSSAKKTATKKSTSKK